MSRTPPATRLPCVTPAPCVRCRARIRPPWRVFRYFVRDQLAAFLGKLPSGGRRHGDAVSSAQRATPRSRRASVLARRPISDTAPRTHGSQRAFERNSAAARRCAFEPSVHSFPVLDRYSPSHNPTPAAAAAAAERVPPDIRYVARAASSMSHAGGVVDARAGRPRACPGPRPRPRPAP